METKTTNFLTDQSKALINSLIYKLQKIQSENLTQTEFFVLTKQLNNIVNTLNAELYTKELSTTIGSRISVLAPSVYPSVRENLVKSLLDSPETKVSDGIFSNENEVIETEKPSEIAISSEEKLDEIIEKEEEKQVTPEEKHEDESSDVVVLAPESEVEKIETPEDSSVYVDPPKEEPQKEIETEEDIAPEKIEEPEPAKKDSESEEKEPEPKKEESSNNYFSLWESFTSNDVPTLLHQDVKEEIKPEPVSNNALSTNEPDLSPIKDLKKSISINDRYLFINELFRGDESAYERSIKTINGFNIYQEANFWIERELKVKLGWQDKDPTVKDFLQLVKRRFQ